MKRARALRRAQAPRVFLDHLRQFLTPSVWKQARNAIPRRRARPRWDLQPLILIALAMTWAAGDAQDERFAIARGFYVAAYDARRRPGRTPQGFHKALARVPVRVLAALAAGVRDRIRARFAGRLLVDGFEPMGCDGSRLECPRVAELEARLRSAGHADAAPTLWVTAFVHLASGMLWAWQLGPGNADEARHLRRMLATLSPAALIVADAAFMGYELAWAILDSRRGFLLRMSSKAHLYTPGRAAVEAWGEGEVYYWPRYAQESGRPPVRGRLIRIRAAGPAKHDVWLLTSVLDPDRLSAATAGKFYRWRWRNEGVFRTYKRTIGKMKLSGRTVRLAHREAFVSLLALQLLLAHAEWALRPRRPEGRAAISPRRVLYAIREEMSAPRARGYARRLRACRAAPRVQGSPKARREWPRRKPHKPPAAPRFHTLTERQKVLLQEHFPPA